MEKHFEKCCDILKSVVTLNRKVFSAISYSVALSIEKSSEKQKRKCCDKNESGEAF